VRFSPRIHATMNSHMIRRTARRRHFSDSFQRIAPAG
jgi:hypothetical protein